MNALVRDVRFLEERVPLHRSQDDLLHYVQTGGHFELRIDLYVNEEDLSSASFAGWAEMSARIEAKILEAFQPPAEVTPTPPEVIEQSFSGRKIVLDS